MNKIITVTANTAIDRLIFPPEANILESSTLSFAAGKGINVARTAATLGKRVVAIGFVGQNEGDLFQALATANLSVQLIPVPGVTRVNTTRFDPRTGTTTHERTSGFEVAETDMVELIRSLDRLIERGDYVVLSGSLPPGAPASLYGTIIERCRERGGIVILDSSGDELRLGIRNRPFLIKPNLEELEELTGRQFRDAAEAAIIEAARNTGVELVLVSRGQDGIILVQQNTRNVIRAGVRLDRPSAPTGNVGSGDALVAGFIVALLDRMPLEEAVRLGVACGAANVLSLGPGLCLRADIERLRSQVDISTVEQ